MPRKKARTRSAPMLEWLDYCDVCGEETLFRRPRASEPWVCTRCFTADPPTEDGEGEVAAPSAAIAKPPAPRITFDPPQRKRNLGVGGGIVAALVVLAVIGIATAGGDSSAECGPFFAPCTLTLNNHGFWPERIDGGSVQVDGTPVQAGGSGFAGPFGSGSVTLYDPNGTTYTASTIKGHIITFNAGPVPGPLSAQIVTMQSDAAATPAATATIAADTPTPDTQTPDTPIPASTSGGVGGQDGDVHLCEQTSYDDLSVTCRVDLPAGDSAALDKVEVVWPVSKGGTDAVALQLLRQDDAGIWQVDGSAPPDHQAIRSFDGKQDSEILSIFLVDAGVIADCGTTYMVRVVNADNHRFGQAPFTLAC